MSGAARFLPSLEVESAGKMHFDMQRSARKGRGKGTYRPPGEEGGGCSGPEQGNARFLLQRERQVIRHGGARWRCFATCVGYLHTLRVRDFNQARAGATGIAVIVRFVWFHIVLGWSMAVSLLHEDEDDITFKLAWTRGRPKAVIIGQRPQ